MRRTLKALTGSALVSVMACGAGLAQGLVLDEFRAGVFAHNAYVGFIPTSTNFDFSRIENVKFSTLFASPDIDAFTWIGSPRIETGATLNLAGRGENLVHANLNWQFGLFDTPVYLELGFGGAVTDGALRGAAAPARNFGCALNFYESFGIGAHLSETMTATLVYEHISNLGICTPNDGISNVGLQVGFKF